MRVEERAVLLVPPDAVWSRMLRWEEQPRWMRDAASVRVLTREREGVGVRVAVRTKVLGLPLFSEELEVIVWEPPRRLRLAHANFLTGFGEWILEPLAGGTRFRWIEDISIRIPVLGELLLLAYLPFLRRTMRRSLAALADWMRVRPAT